MRESKVVDGIYLDFSKAFETISHRILQEKLAGHGLNGCTARWVKNWRDGQAQGMLMFKGLSCIGTDFPGKLLHQSFGGI